MTDGTNIVKEELTRQIKGTIPLLFVTYAGFALTGRYGVSIIVSLLLGAAYSLYLFYAAANAGVRALRYGNPGQAQAEMTRKYLMRYGMTAVLIVMTLRIPFMNTLAFVIPLFYVKIILIISNRKSRKGG